MMIIIMFCWLSSLSICIDVALGARAVHHSLRNSCRTSKDQANLTWIMSMISSTLLLYSQDLPLHHGHSHLSVSLVFCAIYIVGNGNHRGMHTWPFKTCFCACYSLAWDKWIKISSVLCYKYTVVLFTVVYRLWLAITRLVCAWIFGFAY